MFGSGPRKTSSFSSRYGAGKNTKPKRSFKETSIQQGLTRSQSTKIRNDQTSPEAGDALKSPIVTLCVGPDQRVFAGHEHILNRSPYFQAALRGQFMDSATRRINLPEEMPEILSVVLEFLYKADYYPRLLHNKRKDTWELEEGAAKESTIFHRFAQHELLKDTVIYCAADRYGLEDLKRLALRKQGLQAGVQVGIILASARFAYSRTSETDSKLRAHYLALIIRSRNTFKRSATMQAEMEKGGKLFFDLFVAMCNHMDDLSTMRSPFMGRSPRS